MNNHSSHINLEIIELARASNVIILALPSKTTHILLPLDSAAWQHTMPTRRDDTLDLIMSDFPSWVTVTSQPQLGATDHVLIADFPRLVPKESVTCRTVWRYNHVDGDRLRHFYKESDWESSLKIGNPDQSWESVSSLILSGMQKFILCRESRKDHDLGS